MEVKELVPWNWFKRGITASGLEGEKDNSLWSKFDKDIVRAFENFAKDFGNVDTVFSKIFRGSGVNNLKILPRIDVSEHNKEYIIEADLPGVKQEDLEISVSKDGALVIKSKREEQAEHRNQNYYRLERSHGSFESTLALPDNCDNNHVNASFENGSLTIKVPKKEPAPGEIKKIKLNPT